MNLLFEMQRGPAVVLPMSFVELGVAVEAVRAPALADADAAIETVEDRGEVELEAARDAGREETRELCERRLHEGIETERSAVAHVCGSFMKAREKYFAEVEGEVVRLALAVAARILQREVAMDPVLLAGVVRVALGKLGDAEGAVLHIPAGDAERWRTAMRVNPALVVEGDASMLVGECRLEAPAGVAELGVKAQLVEIERGFFDLLARRPA